MLRSPMMKPPNVFGVGIRQSPVAGASAAALTPLSTTDLRVLYSYDTATVSGTSMTDLSGSGHTGVLVNGVTIGAGSIAQAGAFSLAASQSVTVSLVAGNSGPFDLMGTASWGVTVTCHLKMPTGGTNGALPFCAFDSPGNKGYFCYIGGAGELAHYARTAGAGGVLRQGVSTATIATDGAWHTTTWVYDKVNGIQRAYFDGVKVLDLATGGNPAESIPTQPQINTVFSGFKDASYDELAVWIGDSAAISDAQAATIHQLRLRGIPLKTHMGL